MNAASVGNLSEIIDQTGSAEMHGKYLTFLTDQQLFGVPISDVVQIVGMQPITPIPDFPSYAKGVIHLRGSMVPLIDVRIRFGKAERIYDERTCIIVTLIGNLSVGFIVDEVDSVTDIGDEHISVPPKLSYKTTDSRLVGVARLEDKVVLLLNAATLLSEEALADLTSTGGM